MKALPLSKLKGVRAVEASRLKSEREERLWSRRRNHLGGGSFNRTADSDSRADFEGSKDCIVLG